MSEHDSDRVEVTLTMSKDMLDAMRRVRDNQRAGRRRRRAELSDEDPARVVTKLLMESYGGALRSARIRDDDDQPGSQWM